MRRTLRFVIRKIRNTTLCACLSEIVKHERSVYKCAIIESNIYIDEVMGKKEKKKMIEDGKDVSIRDKIKRDPCTNHDDLSNGKILAT